MVFLYLKLNFMNDFPKQSGEQTKKRDDDEEESSRGEKLAANVVTPSGWRTLLQPYTFIAIRICYPLRKSFFGGKKRF